MDKTDVKIITEIMLTADGGCSPCVTSLLFRFINEYPSFKQEIISTVEQNANEYPGDEVLAVLLDESNYV